METNKLIDRLRELSKIGIVNYKHDTPVLIEAADRIEELDERIAIMQESMAALEKRCNALEALEQRCKTLEKQDEPIMVSDIKKAINAFEYEVERADAEDWYSVIIPTKDGLKILAMLKNMVWNLLTEDSDGIIHGLPGDDGQYLMTDGKEIWIDDYVDGVTDGIILDSGRDIREIKAWMYMPELPKKDRR